MPGDELRGPAVNEVARQRAALLERRLAAATKALAAQARELERLSGASSLLILAAREAGVLRLPGAREAWPDEDEGVDARHEDGVWIVTHVRGGRRAEPTDAGRAQARLERLRRVARAAAGVAQDDGGGMPPAGESAAESEARVVEMVDALLALEPGDLPGVGVVVRARSS